MFSLLYETHCIGLGGAVFTGFGARSFKSDVGLSSSSSIY